MSIGDFSAARDGWLICATVVTAIIVGACVSAMLSAFMLPEVRSPAPVTATASPPATGRIRTWAAEGHWWVVGDGWGVHHPGCPCGVKGEVE